MGGKKLAACLGLAMTLPMPLLLVVAIFKIQPLEAILRSWVTEPDGSKNSIAGLMGMLGCMLLLPMASWVSLAPLRLSRIGVKGALAHPLNVAVGLATALLFTGLAGAMVVDQFPCWFGRANCD